jgi:ribosomal protein S12 methylthiotransferase
MKTKSRHKNKINIVTLGCSKNHVDSENIYTQLKSSNLEVEHEGANDSNIVIVNTCGFIENAKQESIDTILAYAKEKEAGNVEQLIVTGCLSERYKEDLSSEINQVDAWYGTMELPFLVERLGADYKHDLLGERQTTTPFHFSYMKISEGCDRPCSFCAIPLMRGGHVSRSIEDLVKEAKNLVKNGTKELMLIAQDSTYYGLDLYGERKLADLMKHLSDVEGLDWIRLHYAYPSKFPMDVLPVMAERDNICNYLDIPIQHISDPVLKTMRRGITKRRTDELLHQIKDEVPGIALRTTLLVGHPGEGQNEYEELKEYIQKFEFDRLGVFTYSHEEDTHAYTLKDEVPQEEKERRADEIMEVQQDVSLKKNEALVGKTLKVLFDRKEGEYFIGRTEFDSPEVDNEVLVHAGDNYIRQGDFADIQITHCSDFDLYGILAS